MAEIYKEALSLMAKAVIADHRMEPSLPIIDLEVDRMKEIAAILGGVDEDDLMAGLIIQAKLSEMNLSAVDFAQWLALQDEPTKKINR